MMKHTVAIWPCNSTPRYITKWKETLCPPRNFYTNVYSTIIHKSPKLKTTQMFISWWVDKSNGVYSLNGVLFSNEREWRSDTGYQHGAPQKHVLHERSQSQKALWCMGPFIRNIQDRQISSDRKKISADLSLGMKVGDGQWEVTANTYGVSSVGWKKMP